MRMAMYLFASRLSSAVWARKPPARSDVTRRNFQEPSSQISPGPSLADEGSAVVTSQRPVERGGEGRRTVELLSEQRDAERRTAERRIVELLEAEQLFVEERLHGEKVMPEGELQRNAVTRASVGACGRSHRCAGSPTAPRRRVRFANTFPRVNRKKVITRFWVTYRIIMRNP